MDLSIIKKSFGSVINKLFPFQCLYGTIAEKVIVVIISIQG
ncbi:MAG: hypothetical protein JETT_1266 [Candidatus Jettenia ecosi]|uniref:Uncharacterized protein n=1 Tax=Candidatus Jettenia ecosi TaxID=2494326 RepID=A0A533QIB6_9BACT|nr:MAG: hypothetical protein JETT_1266 [Candidatus Jettenia ecosi]